MRKLDKLYEEMKSEASKKAVVLVSGNNYTTTVQNIVKIAVQDFQKVVEVYNFLGWSEDFDLDTVGKTKLSDEECIENVVKAIKQIPDKINKNNEPYIYIFDIMDEEILTEEIIDSINDVASVVKSNNCHLFVCFYTQNNTDDYLQREDVKALLKNPEVGYVHNYIPTKKELAPEIHYLLDIIKKVRHELSWVDKNGDLHRKEIDFPEDPNNELYTNLAELMEGLSVQQASAAVSMSITANHGEIVPDFIKKEAEYFRKLNNGEILEDHLSNKISELKGLEDWVNVENRGEFIFRIMAEYIYSRHPIIHLLVQEGDFDTFLPYIINGIDQFPIDKSKSIAVYNADSCEVEMLHITNVDEDEKWSNSDGFDVFEKQRESNLIFDDLKNIISDTENKISPIEILKWFKKTEDKKILLIMKNYKPQSLVEEALLRYIMSIESVSYKNLVTTHEKEHPVRYSNGESYVVLKIQ